MNLFDRGFLGLGLFICRGLLILEFLGVSDGRGISDFLDVFGLDLRGCEVAEHLLEETGDVEGSLSFVEDG